MTGRPTQLSGLVLPQHGTIRDAMAMLTANGREIVLVRDGEDRIQGLLTDGDIRRGLLAGLTLQSPATKAMQRDFFSVTPAVQRAAVLDLMKARSFRHVPVLDDDRRLLAVHFLSDLIGAKSKPNIAVIMAGGQGSRLRPLTDTVPKPMVQVAGRPMLERIVLHLIGHGIRKIFLSVNYRAEVIEAHFGDGQLLGCQIDYLREVEPLGTGGSLTLLKQRPTDPILVLNGDQITQADVSAMLEYHTRGGFSATVGIGPHQIQIPFATVVERDGRLIKLHEKPTVSYLVNRGIYILEPSTLDLVPQARVFPMTALFEQLLDQGRHVGTFYFDDYWLDVGRPNDLLQANGLT